MLKCESITPFGKPVDPVKLFELLDRQKELIHALFSELGYEF